MPKFGFIVVLVLALLSAVQAELLLNPVRVETEKSNGRHALVLYNPWPAPVTLQMTFTLENALLDTSNPVTIVVPAKGRALGPVIRRDDEAYRWRWRYTTFYHFGDWRKLKTVGSFALPYNQGAEFQVYQGFNGQLSHKGKDAYALDFDMPEGTEVRAAREGLVVKVEEGFKRGGWDLSLREQANTVILAHEDGTLSRYVHLQHNSVVVETGDWVETGALLGLSGNTGYSKGPHLHFDVYSPGDDLKVRTLKFKIRVNGHDIAPKEGDVYRN